MPWLPSITTVSPRWIEGSEKFWYEWENADGSFYYIVDPVRSTKSQLFDNDRIAAELTRIADIVSRRAAQVR